MYCFYDNRDVNNGRSTDMSYHFYLLIWQIKAQNKEMSKQKPLDQSKI